MANYTWPASGGGGGGGPSTSVSVTNFPGTQAISAAALPLPTGAATSAKQPALGTAGTASSDVLTVQGIASMTALKVDGSAITQPVSASSLPLPTGAATETTLSGLNTKFTTTANGIKVDGSSVTQPVSASSLPLPTGAATSAKQPALGTAGTPATDVLTVQGATSMTALKVDGSAVTQPVSGTVSAKAATPTAGTITQAAITVGTTAVRCTVAGTAPNSVRKALAVCPDSASTGKFYLGSSTVTSSGATRGIPITAGQVVTFDFDAGDYYVISDTASQTVYIMEQV